MLMQQTLTLTDSRDLVAWPTLTGRQEPENLVMTAGDYRQGNEVIVLASRAGSKLMPWQSGLVRCTSAKTPAGTWVYGTVIWIVPRQNGKSEALADLILYRIFVLKERVVYTSHEWKSAREIAERLQSMIESRPWLSRRVKKMTNSQGEAIVELKDDKNGRAGKVYFRTRSAKAGRGLDEVDTLIYDEAYSINEASVAALNPTQNAAKDPQVIYASSAVNKDDADHAHGVQLSALREAALLRDDPRIFLAEFRAPEGADREDPETWRLANPSFGVIHNERKIETLKKNMLTPEGQKRFDVEALGIGDYFTLVKEVEEDPSVIDLARWRELNDRAPVATGKYCLCVDASNDVTNRTWSVAVAASTKSGKHGQLGFHGHATVAQIVKFIVAANEYNELLAVVVDPKSAAAVIIQKLIDEGIEPQLMNSTMVASSTQSLLQNIDDGIFTHDDDPRMEEAIAVARLREIGDGGIAWTKRKSGGNISQLVAMTHAAYGLEAFDVELNPPASISFADTRPLSRPRDELNSLLELKW
ncbi:hypothetical protein WG936_08160 [Corynebacterium sp. H127]|uniref:hypothetical protein n=1 Tax=Corynebacterium sp. H127 TaxID=3133418 RepID=UPI003097D18E